MVWWRSQKERDRVDDLDVDGRIMLQGTWNRMEWRGPVLKLEDCFEHDIGISDSILKKVIFWQTEGLVASEEGLSFIELQRNKLTKL